MNHNIGSMWFRVCVKFRYIAAPSNVIPNNGSRSRKILSFYFDYRSKMRYTKRASGGRENMTGKTLQFFHKDYFSKLDKSTIYKSVCDIESYLQGKK